MKPILRFVIRTLVAPSLWPRAPLPIARAWTKLLGSQSPALRSLVVDEVVLDSVPAERLVPKADGRADLVLVYIHGGGFRIGSAEGYRNLTAVFAKAARATVYAPDYRLTPEHAYPAAHDDAYAATRAVLALHPDATVVLGGDSAGGCLALATAQRLRDDGEKRLAGLFLISPWTDLAMTGESARTLDAIDPFLHTASLDYGAKDYLRGVDPTSPSASPLYASFEGLPPIHIEVGSDEILLDDSKRAAKKARSANVPVTIEVTEGLWHDFPMHKGVLPEADRAIDRIAAFVTGLAGAATTAAPQRESSRKRSK